MKSASLIVFALFIDGVQAALSAALAVIAAFPGTIAGGTAGCLAGKFIFGDVGCFVLGLVGGLFGTLLDSAAIVTEPLGIVLGFVVSICLTVTLGAALIGLLIFNKMYYPRFIFGGGIVELIPGFDLLPSWTAMTVLCVLRKNKDEKLARIKNTAQMNSNAEESITVAQIDARNAPDDSSNPAAQPSSRIDGIRPPYVSTPRNDNLKPPLLRNAA